MFCGGGGCFGCHGYWGIMRYGEEEEDEEEESAQTWL